MSRLPRAPLTLALLLAGAFATLLLADRPAAWSIATTWLIHADWHHLLCDLVAIAAIGFWLEPRAGSARLAIWIALAWGVSIAAHRGFYPDQSHLFGLSAIAWCLAAVAVARHARGRNLLLALLMLTVLGYECLGNGAGVLTSIGKHAACERPFIPDLTLRPVPWVHAASALLGAALGLAARSPDSRPARLPKAQPDPGDRHAPTATSRLSPVRLIPIRHAVSTTDSATGWWW